MTLAMLISASLGMTTQHCQFGCKRTSALTCGLRWQMVSLTCCKMALQTPSSHEDVLEMVETVSKVCFMAAKESIHPILKTSKNPQ